MSVPLKQRLLGVFVLVLIMIFAIPALLEQGEAPVPETLQSAIPTPPPLPKTHSTIVLSGGGFAAHNAEINEVEPDIDEADMELEQDESLDPVVSVAQQPQVELQQENISSSTENNVKDKPDAPVKVVEVSKAVTAEAKGNPVTTVESKNDKTPSSEQHVSHHKASQSSPASSVQTEVERPVNPDLKESAWIIQLASFKSDTNAKRLVTKLRADNFVAFFHGAADGSIYRVFVGPELDKALLEKQLNKIAKEYKLKGFIKRYRPADF